MLDLLLSVLCSSLIFVIFKLFSIYKVQTFYAIITNYVVACSVGMFFYQGEINVAELPEKPWFWGTFILGILFIIVFNLMAATSQKLGVSVASVATKMSLVVPVLFGVFHYKEVLGPLTIIGVLLALAAVYFASIKEKKTRFNIRALILPFLVFAGSGAIDTSLAYFQKEYISNHELPLFSATVFASAAIMGIAYLLIRSSKNPMRINVRDILGGVVLGVPNYFSIYFLLRALQSDTLTSASIFTLNNVAIVMCSTVLGIVLFKEQLSKKNWVGIALAVISIILVAGTDG